MIRNYLPVSREANYGIRNILGALLCLVFFSAIPVLAQKTSGQLSGTVLDVGGGALPDATIVVSQVGGTGSQRTITSNSEGSYTIADLPIGIYRISVTKNGFKESVVENVTVNVASATRQDITLQVGGVGEIVTVTADTVQIETQTGAIGEIVTGQQVQELPLNGRNFVQLTQLQPGVAAQSNFDSKSKALFGGVDFSVNGNSAQSNLFLTDGANNNDTGSNRTILLFPSIEAIAEFKTLRNSYGPEYGQAAGAVISIATRGGTNDFHGSVYYFGRNDALNSADFFVNRSGLKKDILRRNDYGFAVGGPIIKDRLFFFYSQEFNKEIRGQARFGSVPTLLERQGNFSSPRFASNGAACSGPAIGNGRPGSTNQIIPQASLSPAGLALIKLLPEPNVNNGSCNNWAISANSPINFREENVRIDYNLTKNNKIFGRYTKDDWSNAYPILVGNLWGDDGFPAVESSWAQPSQQAAFKLTTTLSTTAINEVQFSYSANKINITPGSGGDINRAINQAIPGYYSDSLKVNGVDRPHPVFWGGIAPYNYGTGQDLWAQLPFHNSLNIYSIRDDASKVSNTHTFKMGFLYDTATKIEDSGPSNETPQFWGAGDNNSGNYLANILTQGSLFGFNETNTMAVGQTRYKNLEFYFGDTWKVRPNVTLELGARYSLLFEPYDLRNRITSFSAAAYNPNGSASDSCNGLVVPKGTNPCAGISATQPQQFSNRSLRDQNYKNLAPRLGVAWDVFSNGKTAIRAGFGQFFLRQRTSIYFGGLTQNPPFAASISGQRTLDGTSYVGLSAASNGAPKYSLDPEAGTPYSLQYNVSVGQQLAKDTVIEVGYVANRARRQLTHSDINQVKAANRLQAAFATDANVVNSFRPFSNYGSIYEFEQEGKADYNSLQVLFRTRFGKYSQFQAAYTFSKSQADFGLSDSNGGSSNFAVLDRNNRSLDFANSDINRPHIFVANLIYNLPAFTGSNALVKGVLGGWEAASIVRITSGVSLTPQLAATGIQNSGGQAFQGGITGLGTNVANQRPLRVEGVPCTLDNADKTLIINPAAFTLVGYKIGETIPKKTTCLGPATKNVDFSIYKNFTPSWLKSSFLGEGARLQFRLEFFNAFNTPQFRGDGANLPITFYAGPVSCGGAVCTQTNNTITSAGVNGNFGVAARSTGSREIQYALKLVF